MNIQIKEATIEDIEELINVETMCLRCFHNLNLKNNIDYLKKNMQYSTYLIALLDNKIIGFSSYNKNNDSINPKYKEYAQISNLYVLKEYHKKGIGKLLFKTTIDAIKKLSYSKFYIASELDLDFFIKYGGKKEEEIFYTGCYAVTFDVNESLKLLKK